MLRDVTSPCTLRGNTRRDRLCFRQRLGYTLSSDGRFEMNTSICYTKNSDIVIETVESVTTLIFLHYLLKRKLVN